MGSVNDDYVIGINVISAPVYTSPRQINIKGSRKDRNFLPLESMRMGLMPVTVGLEERLSSEGGPTNDFYWDDNFGG